MRVAVVGTGGVGGFFGGLLAHVGHDVAFVARGAHLRAIRARGLRIDRAQGDSIMIAPANATDDPGELEPVDLVLLAVKSYHLDDVLEQMRPLVDSHTAILTTQNGVEAPDKVRAVYGPGFVLPGLVYSEVAVRDPGVIFQGAAVARLVFGEPDSTRSPRAVAIAEAFEAAGVETTLSENVLGALWSKFCFICAMGGITAITRMPLGPLLGDPEGRQLITTVMDEVYRVGIAAGIRFDVNPVKSGLSAVERFTPDTKSSMLRDLEAGRPLEAEALNGAAVRIGRQVGVPTPANQAIYAALRMAQPRNG